MSSFKTRFAPSPTGRIHMGNVRTALMCWCYAKRSGGELILRIDDTDLERSESRLIDLLKEDLAWLGITYRTCFQQSDRVARYNELAESLKSVGLLYPCYETKDELESARKTLLKMKKPPVYRKGFEINSSDIAKVGKPCWRFALDATRKLEWNDLIKGHMSVPVYSISDPIVIRQDGTYTYMLPSVIDDYDYKITHVVRGDDHLTNTAVQIAMFEAIGATVPEFAHIPLLQDRDSKLSKRKGSHDIDHIKKLGITVEAIISYLLSLGSSRPQLLSLDVNDYIEGFDIMHYNKGACIFMMESLIKTNAAILRNMSFERVQRQFPDLTAHGSESVWNIVRKNISLVSEFAGWLDNFAQNAETPITPTVDKEHIVIVQEVYASLQPIEWNEAMIKGVLGELAQKFGVRPTMRTIRKALTGVDHGPELANILLMMGKDRVIDVLKSVLC